MTRIILSILAVFFFNSCKMVDQMYENSSLAVMLVGVALTVALIVYFLGRVRNKTK